LATLLLGLMAPTPRALALIRLDEGRNQIFVTGSFSTGYSSNIGASAGGKRDNYFSASVGAQYQRQAGLIVMDSSVSMDATSYIKNTGESFRDPSFKTEFKKRSGRTTGSLKLSAARESRADTAANIRNESWSYQASLDARYPMLAGKYAFLPSIGWSLRDFADNKTLADQKSVFASLDFYYTLDERSLLAGYRFRQESTSLGTGSRDHSFTAGVSGPLLFRLNGTLRAGYQVRTPYGITAGRDTYTGWTANGSSTWEVTKRLDFSGQLSRDFSTTSTNVSVDTLGGTVRGQYRFNTQTSFSASTGATRTRFLDGIAGNRLDTSWNWDVTLYRSIFNQHIQLSLSYNYFKNWSSSSFSTFDRTGLTFTASAKY
jgi:hypothetical protein